MTSPRTPEKVSEVFQWAINLLQEKGWIRNKWAETGYPERPRGQTLVQDISCLCMTGAVKLACGAGFDRTPGSSKVVLCATGTFDHDLYADSVRSLADEIEKTDKSWVANEGPLVDGKSRNWSEAEELCMKWNDVRSLAFEEDVLPLLASARDAALELERGVSDG